MSSDPSNDFNPKLNGPWLTPRTSTIARYLPNITSIPSMHLALTFIRLVYSGSCKEYLCAIFESILLMITNQSGGERCMFVYILLPFQTGCRFLHILHRWTVCNIHRFDRSTIAACKPDSAQHLEVVCTDLMKVPESLAKMDSGFHFPFQCASTTA